MAQITLHVPDISCGHCKLSIERAVRGVGGVVKAQVHVKQRTIDVEFEKNSVSRAAIVAAIEGQGYGVEAG